MGPESNPLNQHYEEEEDEEPFLKYIRLVPQDKDENPIFLNESVTCLSVFHKFLALGTINGKIHILDFNGNVTNTLSPHTASINDLSIDLMGDYIASCSIDGKVVITALSTYNDPVVILTPSVIHSVAIDPEYSRKSTKRCVFGGRSGELILNIPSFLGLSTKNQVLNPNPNPQTREGPIHVVKWRGPFIAWATDKDVKIIDATTYQRVTKIETKPSPNVDLSLRYHLSWKDEQTIIIGYNNTVQVCQIKEMVNPTPGSTFVELWEFQTDYIISGLCPFEDKLAIVSFQEKGQNPDLRLVDYDNFEHSVEELPLRGIENCDSSHFRLEQLPGDIDIFYIVSPKDIIVVRRCDIEDRLKWLTENKKYEQALKTVQEHEKYLKPDVLVDIGEKYISHLLDKKDYVNAANLCASVLKKNSKLWEKWIFEFLHARQIKHLIYAIPTSNPRLDGHLYKIVLETTLKNDREEFKKIVELWPPTIYNTKDLIAIVEKERMSTPDSNLTEALIKLYTNEHMVEKALDLILRSKKGDPFRLIEKESAQLSSLSVIKDRVLDLISFNEVNALQLLINKTDIFSPLVVTKQLEKYPKTCYEYLYKLFKKDPPMQLPPSLNAIQVHLYAQFNPAILVRFLRQSPDIDLNETIDLCRNYLESTKTPSDKTHISHAMVYLLGRMGQNKEALNLLVVNLGNIKEAIEFVQSQHDDDLWEELISQSMKSKDAIVQLLEHAGSHVDPVKIIRRIPERVQIPGLRDRLIKITSDFNLQASLREGCNVILQADCVNLIERLVKLHDLGHLVEESTTCATCGLQIMPPTDDDIAVFCCSHIFHVKCLRPAVGSPSPTSLKNRRKAPTKTLTDFSDLLGPIQPSVPPSEERLSCVICLGSK